MKHNKLVIGLSSVFLGLVLSNQIFQFYDVQNDFGTISMIALVGFSIIIYTRRNFMEKILK